MKYQINKSTINSVFLILFLGICVSCNRDFEQPPPITPTNPSGQTIMQIINAGPNYNILKAGIVKAGMDSLLNTNGLKFTLFAPDDNAFALSGITPATLQGLSAIEIQEVLSYHIIGGVALTSSAVPATFPNVEMPTLLPLDPSDPFFKVNIFPTTLPGSFYVNNIPVTIADQQASNGVIHTVAAIITPPTQLLAQIIYGDTSLTYFSAAIARADSGQVGLSRIDSLLKYPVINMTVLAPNNSAFKTILYEEIYGALLQQGVPSANASAAASALSSSPTVFSNPAVASVLTPATVQGIVSYHILAVNNEGSFQPVDRVFSVNFPKTPGQFVTTLVNTVYPTHPGVMAQVSFTGPFATGIQFTGLGTFPPGGTPYSGGAANAVKFDEIGVNGVVHVIDKVLLPQ
jgi:uncharacterized surface protein with fasciclin (FAS1) repeats